MGQGFLLGRLLLQFREEDEALPENLSASVRTPEGHLWVASDERGFLERLTPKEPRVYGDHVRYALSDYLDVEGDGEVDIEALDHEDGASGSSARTARSERSPRARQRRTWRGWPPWSTSPPASCWRACRWWTASRANRSAARRPSRVRGLRS